MDRKLIAKQNREQMPALYKMLEEVMPDLQAAFPGTKLMHGTDETTRMEVGQKDAVRLHPWQMKARPIK